MKIILEGTSKIITLNDVQCRVWEGFTEEGIPCHAYIANISPDTTDERQRSYFHSDLHHTKRPSPNIATLPEHQSV